MRTLLLLATALVTLVNSAASLYLIYRDSGGKALVSVKKFDVTEDQVKSLLVSRDLTNENNVVSIKSKNIDRDGNIYVFGTVSRENKGLVELVTILDFKIKYEQINDKWIPVDIVSNKQVSDLVVKK